jgi:hypothetical protein
MRRQGGETAGGAGERAPIQEVLGHVATELRGLCYAAYEVESAVGALITNTDPASLAELRGLQELDRLIQHIDGIASYLSEIARAANGLGEVDVTAARGLVKLERLAAGLAGRSGPSEDRGFELL